MAKTRYLVLATAQIVPCWMLEVRTAQLVGFVDCSSRFTAVCVKIRRERRKAAVIRWLREGNHPIIESIDGVSEDAPIHDFRARI